MFADSKMLYFIVCIMCFDNQSNFFSNNFLMFDIFQKAAYFDNDQYAKETSRYSETKLRFKFVLFVYLLIERY